MVRLTMVVLPMIGVALATEVGTCSVTGTCSEKIDHAILLQAHDTNDRTIHRRIKLVSEIEHMVDSALKLGAPLKTVQTVLIEASKRNEPGSWGDTEKKLFNDLIKSIETDMIGFLDGEHRSDKSEYETAKDHHEQCHTHTSDRFGLNGDLKQAENEVQTERAKHKACRKMEKTWNLYQTAANSVCPVANLGMAKFQEEDEHKDLVTKIQNLRTDKQSYAAAGGSATSCDTNQVELETEYCNWRTTKRAACTSEKHCTDAAGLQGTINRINTRITNRKAIYVTLKKVLCRIRHLLKTFDQPDKDVSDFDTADNCDSTDPADKDTKYDIAMNVPDSPKCKTDGSVAVRPSTTNAALCSSWRQQEYDVWTPATAYVVPSGCEHDCKDVAHPTPTAPDAGCTDQDATQCAKFEHHQDMCTMAIYKTGTFDAETACCYCGGGNSPTKKMAGGCRVPDCGDDCGGKHGGLCACGSGHTEATCTALWEESGLDVMELYHDPAGENCYLMHKSKEAPSTCPASCNSHAGQSEVSHYVGNPKWKADCFTKEP